MITLKSKILITMIPLLLVFSPANATTLIMQKTASTQQSLKMDVKAIVLAKGQNHLPKQTGCKETCVC